MMLERGEAMMGAYKDDEEKEEEKKRFGLVWNECNKDHMMSRVNVELAKCAVGMSDVSDCEFLMQLVSVGSAGEHAPPSYEDILAQFFEEEFEAEGTEEE